MKTQLIELSKLEKSPLNTRRTMNKAGLADLQASLLSHGLMQNLVVTPEHKGKFHVIAGARRLQALQQLQKTGKLAPGHKVPCQIAEDENALEMSLAENTIRHAMHPADEFEAYAALQEGKDGLSVPKIAERFGVTEKHVQQRLKLGRLHPELLKLYREEEINLNSLEAFTLCDDKEQQLKTYKALNQWEKNSPHSIRSHFTKKMVPSDNKIVRFVGVKDYVAAGGTLRSNLFGEVQYIENSALLTRLATEKLQAVADKLSQSGWAWVDVALEKDYSAHSGLTRLEPSIAIPKTLSQKQTKLAREIEKLEELDETTDETDAELEAKQAELEKLEEEINFLDRFTPEEMKKAGCYVSLNHNGLLDIEQGIVKKKHEKLLPPREEAKAPKVQKKDMSDGLRQDLRNHRLQVARLALTDPKNAGLTFSLLAFHLVKTYLLDSPAFYGPAISLRQTVQLPSAKSGIGIALAKRKTELPTQWFDKKESEAKQFAAFMELPPEKKLQLLAWCTAISMEGHLSTDLTSKDLWADEICYAGTGFKVYEHWRPNAENYFSRITKEQLLGIGADIFGKAWAEDHKTRSKQDLVEELDKEFANPLKNPNNKTAEIEILQTWLPAGMAFHTEQSIKAIGKQKRAA